MAEPAILSLVFAARTAGWLARPAFEPGWAGVAPRVGARIDLPMGIDVEGGFTWAPAQPRAGVERWAATVRLAMPLGPPLAVRPMAFYGWEYTALSTTTPGHPERAFGTLYGLGFAWAVTDAVALQPSLHVRSDTHLSGGACLRAPACTWGELWGAGRLTGVVELDLVVRLGHVPPATPTAE